MGSNPYPPIEHWRLPSSAVAATLSSVVGAGRRGDEAGVFWLGERSKVSRVRAVVSLRGRGVLESPGRWQVSSAVYGVVSRLAREHELTLLGTAHTHGRGSPSACLSPTAATVFASPTFLRSSSATAAPTTTSMTGASTSSSGATSASSASKSFTSAWSPTNDEIDLWRASVDGAIRWSGRENE